jgi:DNA polymerase
MTGDGPRDAEIMVVGEAPGQQEDARGKPFIGRSGQLLRGELEKARLTEPFITNVVRCRPPDNRKPTPEEIKACRKYLDYEIASVKPSVIVTAGATPAKALLKKPGITEARGRMIPVPGFPEITGMPMFHPAYALRDPSKLPMITQDLQRLSRFMTGSIESCEVRWKLVDRKTCKEFIAAFKAAEEFAFDIETNGLFPYDGKGLITCLSIAIGDTGWVIPWNRVSIERGPEIASRAEREFFLDVFGRLVSLQRGSGKWAAGQTTP